MKMFWAVVSGGDVSGVLRTINDAKQTYKEMIDDFNSGADKGVAAHNKIAAAAKASAAAQLAALEVSLKKQGKAYEDFANQVAKLMPGEAGYKGSDAYRSWQDLKGVGLTLDEPGDGMTKDDLAAFNKSK